MAWSLTAVLLCGLWSSALGQSGTIGAIALPPERVEMAAARRNFAQAQRLLQAGTGYDRAIVRADLLDHAACIDDLLCGALVGGNHFVQRQMCLVLMETGPRTAPEALLRLVRGEVKGARGLAAFALGKLGDEHVLSALLTLTDSAQPEERRAGMLAIGRLGTEDGVRFLAARTDIGQELERITALLALALASPRGEFSALQSSLNRREDRVRRAALTAAGMLRSTESMAARLHALDDEDAHCRRIALEGLALDAPSELAAQRLIKRWEMRATLSNLEQARLVAALTGALSEAELAPILVLARTHRDSRVRLAVAAAALRRDSARVHAMELLADAEPAVRLTALIAVARLSTQDTSCLTHAQDSAESVRLAALHCEVWKRGIAAGGALRELKDSTHADIRAAAEAALALLAEDPARAVQLARARLQVLLDEAGGAASWNLLCSLHEQLYEVLDLTNSLPRGGGGAAPGGGSAAARALGAAASRASSGDEDLRRHFDIHPYADRRVEWELSR
ncbi:MAG: hypothetical protein EXS14_05975 [Planctomycetes bacterium]|nr:hypothetical protein [Planctomycetota bacterium]